THIAVIFDTARDTFRTGIYEAYKTNRPPPPEELVPQFGLIRRAVKAFNVACIEQDGYEADDLIATYACDALKKGGDVTIVSSDKDLMQLIQPGITMLDTMKNKRIGREEVLERFGVKPEQVVDVQALSGDATDNVPGVPGIGVKTAAELIREFGDLDTLLERAHEIKQPKRRERLIEFAEQARISRELVRLKCDVPVKVPIERLGVQDPDPNALLSFLREMEFNTLTRRIAEKLGVELPPMPEKPAATKRPAEKAPSDPPALAKKADTAALPAGAGTPAAVVAFAEEASVTPAIDRSKYETVTTIERLQQWIAEARNVGRFSIDTESTSRDPMQAELVGFSMAIAPGQACYVPLGHRPANDSFDFGDGSAPEQISL